MESTNLCCGYAIVLQRHERIIISCVGKSRSVGLSWGPRLWTQASMVELLKYKTLLQSWWRHYHGNTCSHWIWSRRFGSSTRGPLMFTQCNILHIKSSSVGVLCPAGDEEILSVVLSTLVSFIGRMLSRAFMSHKKCCRKCLWSSLGSWKT